MPRLSFQEAIEDPLLLRPFFYGVDGKGGLSLPQQVTLKAFYGLPLSPLRINPDTGFSELDYWSIIQGNFEHDELGYPTKIYPTPYIPKEYNQLWAVIARRAGKSSTIQSGTIAYEALLGGHEDYIATGQTCVVYLIAQKLDVARGNLPFIRNILDTSPYLAKAIEAQTADEIRLKNGITIVCSPPTLKGTRGMAVPVVAMDEVAFWYTDADAANPDIEVERAVSKAQLQFPHYKRVGISTPWSKEGLLWKYYKAGTEGIKLEPDKRTEYQGKLVCFSTTASFENPILIEAGGRDRLAAERAEDPDNFDRECLCKFADSISGFFNRKLVEIAADKGKGKVEIAPADANSALQPYYIAAMDPAFRHDSFAFVILHKESDKIVVDLLRRWVPIRGTKLNPATVMAEITDLMAPYGAMTVYTDQYQFESLQQIAMGMGLNVEVTDFTGRSKAKIFGSLEKMLNQQKLELLDPDLSEPAKHLVNELMTLELHRTAQGAVQINAPRGKHDDMACVLALAVNKALWMDPTVTTVDEYAFKEPTIFERGLAQIQRRRVTAQEFQ